MMFLVGNMAKPENDVLWMFQTLLPLEICWLDVYVVSSRIWSGEPHKLAQQTPHAKEKEILGQPHWMGMGREKLLHIKIRTVFGIETM